MTGIAILQKYVTFPLTGSNAAGKITKFIPKNPEMKVRGKNTTLITDNPCFTWKLAKNFINRRRFF